MIEAQELLLQLRVADYPNGKQQDRSRIHHEWFKIAYPASSENRTLSMEETAAKLRAVLNG